jgi:purine-binding chemotaxis protein CheW
MSNNSNTLVDEKVAISLFLDSLLTEPEVEKEVAVAEVVPVVEVKVTEVNPTVTEAKVTVPDVEIELTPELEIPKEVVVEKKVETSVAIESKSIIPEWANEPFQILLFKVAGLKLAVPLVDLCGVIEWKESVTEMPGHADFYMGILQHLDYKIAVIDTARMVLPENKLTQLAGDNPRERVKHIVMIDDYRWGLACDRIGEVITLQPNEVRWRTSKSTREWLAGTVIDHMCALLDSEGFAAMLKNGDKITS